MKRLISGVFISLSLGSVAQERVLPLTELKSGELFASQEIRALQADDFVNPGMLWVSQGEQLWQTADDSGPSCAVCHGEVKRSMRGVATRYPVFDTRLNKLINLTQRINLCRTERQNRLAFAAESPELLALTAYAAHQSRGMPITVRIDGPAEKHFAAGWRFYKQRRGQMNLSCAHCHDKNWGKVLLNEVISQGHSNGYPTYRLEWQTLGSLQRRFRSCLSGIRAEMLPYDSPEYLDLELFLAWRGQGLTVEAPAVRR